MTETDAAGGADVVEQPSETADSAGAESVHCRHCGQPSDQPHAEGEDWLCPSCERFQDTMICPTCGGLARISSMPAEMVPEPHAPTRRRKAKE